ncbi:hypothetical protein [Lactobacillus delbrueckii]|nr:hypothetical protein [Lactobacillus delbrueckii]
MMVIPVFEPLPEVGGKSKVQEHLPKKEQVAKKENVTLIRVTCVP